MVHHEAGVIDDLIDEDPFPRQLLGGEGDHHVLHQVLEQSSAVGVGNDSGAAPLLGRVKRCKAGVGEHD